MADATNERYCQGRRIEVTPVDADLRRKLLTDAFQMPSFQTMVTRKSSITNAFVNSVIPVIQPSLDDIEESLTVLGMVPSDVRCAYCGGEKTTWDHMRPLVLNHRPSGFISEIANLVPSCGTCNSSKGNKPWREWMLGKAKHSPASRGVADVAERVFRLEDYEQWRSPVKVDFEAVLEREVWERYWLLWKEVNAELRKCQEVADSIRNQVIEALGRK
jgi:hypothetical protein